MTDIASLGVQIDAASADVAAKQLDGMAAAGGRAETAATKLGAATGGATSEIDKLRAKQVAQVAAQLGMTEAQARAALGFATTTSAAAGTTAATAAMTSAVGGAAKAATEAAAALGGHSAALHLNQREVIELGGVVREVFEGHFPRAALSAGVLSSRVGLLGLLLHPITIGVAVAGTAFGLMATAMIEAEARAEKFNNTLAATGNFSGFTAQSFDAMAKSIADATGTSIVGASAMMLTYAASGKYTAQEIGQLAGVTQTWADLTGQSTAKVEQEFLKLADAPGKYAAGFLGATHLITAAQVEHIQELEREGNMSDAVALATQSVTDALRKQHAEILPIVQLWRDLTTAVGNWITVAGKARAPGAQATELQGLYNAHVVGDSSLPEIASLKAQQAALDAVAASTAKKTAAEAADGKVQEAGLAASDRLITTLQSYKKNADLAADSVRKLKSDIDAALKANPNDATALNAKANEASLITQINKRYAGSAKGPQDASDQAIDAATKAELTARAALTKNIEELAKLKTDEVAAELKTQTDNLNRQVAEKRITAAASDRAKTLYDTAAKEKDELIARQAEFALADTQLAQRQAIGADQAKLASIQESMATTAAARNQIEHDALIAQQKLDTDALKEKARQEVIIKQKTQAEADALLISQASVQAAQLVQASQTEQIRLLKETLDSQVSQQQIQGTILEAESSVAKSTYSQWQYAKKIEQSQYEIARLKAQEAVDEALVTGNVGDLVEALGTQAAVEKAHAAKLPKAGDDLLAAYSSADGSLSNLAQAVKSHDWAGAWTALAAAVDTLKKTLLDASASTASKIGAVAGVANQVGGAIGGTAGGTIQGAAGGALSGAALAGSALGTALFPGLGTIAGAAIGAVVGGISSLIGGILGGDAKAKQAADAAAQAAQDRLTAIHDQQLQIEIQLQQAQGDTLGALTNQRQAELSKIDASNKALQEQVYAAEDAAMAKQKEADQAKSIQTMEIALAQASGNVVGALTIQRQQELAAIDPTLQALQKLVYAQQDVATAAANAAQIMSTANDLQISYYQALGNTTEATTLTRQKELAALDASLRPLQQAVYAAQDFATAMQAVQAALQNASAAVNTQISAAQSMASAAHTAADAYRQASASLLDSLNSLRLGDQSPLSSSQKLGVARSTLDTTFQGALSGSQTALSALPQAAQDFLTASKANATSQLDYARDFARVQQMLQQASTASTADAGVMDYQSQLLDTQVGLLGQIKDELAKANPDTAILQQEQGLLAHIGELLQGQTQNLLTINSTLTDQTGQIIVGNSIVSAQTGQLVGVDVSQTALLAAAVAAATGQQTGALLAGKYVVTDPQTGQLIGVQVDAAGRISTIASVVNAQTGVVTGASLSGAAAIAQAVFAQTGQVVASNSILNAQTGQLSNVGGAIASGNSTADAIKNLTALDSSYSAQMLQAMANSSSATAGGYSAMVQGVNNTVHVLQDILRMLGSSAAVPAPVSLPAIVTSPASPTTSAYDQAVIDLYAGNASAAQRYLNANPDLVSRYLHPTGNSSEFNPKPGESEIAFAIRHFATFGPEGTAQSGRNLFAGGGYTGAGGVWDVAGTVHKGEVVWSQSDIARSGGVNAVESMRRGWTGSSNDNATALEIKALRAVVERLEAQLASIDRSADKTARSTTDMNRIGIHVHGPSPGDPVTTAAA